MRVDHLHHHARQLTHANAGPMCRFPSGSFAWRRESISPGLFGGNLVSISERKKGRRHAPAAKERRGGERGRGRNRPSRQSGGASWGGGRGKPSIAPV